MDLSFTSPYYAATVLSTTTAAALLISALAGHRHGNPFAGVPVLFLGLIAATCPALYGVLVDGEPHSDLNGPVLGTLAGLGVGAVVGLAVVVPLAVRWSRQSEQ